MKSNLVLLLMSLLSLSAQAHTDVRLAKAVGLARFYADATKLIAANNDTLSAHDFNILVQLIKTEIKPLEDQFPAKLQNECDFILAQINDSNTNSERLSRPKEWLQNLAQTLEFNYSRLDYLLRRHQIENGTRLLHTQIQALKFEAATQAFIELVSTRNDRFHGSFIESTPFSPMKRVKPYLAQIINNMAVSQEPTPQLNLPINNMHVEAAVRQAAELQFQWRQKVERNVTSL